ncbi:AAA family ATPase [Candidatus Venteria ishoeyi]|uniref:Sporulation initiation inhibitor protein Soj n=1 Tax=Candidatus Venteria ishoeyi TaxID=1899563 RepID=A0A1H6F4N7_9GAMM|nr:AAA family ATPase [Candidatus Venteria ishoeyi]SEH05128.1 Sporulation initiation inhibitor protein Soj [Candidatus Venteria ishoeyi]
MIISCNKCHTRYKVKPELLKKNILKVRCSRCQHVFIIETDKKSPIDLDKNDIVSHAQIITICNQKGGVAKTSTCINLGAALSEQNKKVLLVDFDVLANLTLSLGYEKDVSFYQLVQAGQKNIDSVIKQYSKNLWLLPSNSDMNLFPKYYMQKNGFEFLLKNQLKKISENYDYILIDTPPSMEFFTLNALMAADSVIIPTQCEYFSMNGVKEVGKIINILEDKYKIKLPYHILISLFNPKSTAAKVILTQLNKQFSGKILKTIVEGGQ